MTWRSNRRACDWLTKLCRGGGRFILNAVLLTLVLIVVMVPDVFASNVNVTDSSCDDSTGIPYCTIQAAVDAAASGDTINVAAGTYSITSDLTIDKKIILQGSGNDVNPLADTIIELAPPSSTLIDITAGGSTTVDRLEIKNLRVTDTKDSHIGAARSIQINSTGFFLFDNVVFTNNIGTGLMIRGELTGGASTADVVVRNSTFSNNAQASCSNPADIHFFKFGGNARLESVIIDVGTGGLDCSGKPNTSNSYGIQFRGNDIGPAGTIVLQDVTVTGNPNKVGLLIQGYSDTLGFSLSNVDLSGVNPGWSTMVVSHTGIPSFLLGNTNLPDLALWNTGGVDATNAIFTGTTNNFEIEDVVSHALDVAGLGLVRWVPNNVYVTPNSGSIQRGIDVVQDGDTINVVATVDISGNWWGHTSGPTHSSNPQGQGKTVTNNINFDPWYLNSARTNLSSDQSGSKLTPQGNTVKFDSDDANSGTKGKASLPPGIEEIELGNDAVIDLVANIDTASGNNIQVGGTLKDLSNFTSGTLTGVDLTTTKTVGDKSVLVRKAVKMESGIDLSPIIIKNIALPNFQVSIPDATTILAPDGWSGTIQPPKTGSSSGTPPSGFSIGGTVIEVGSPDVVLLFDTPVDVLLSGVTGNVGYKPAGSSTWVQITNTCGNTFDIPDPPTFPGECFISNGVDTKIVTYHFTEFGELDPVVVKSSGGGGGGGGDRTKPVLQSNSLSSPGSVIFGGSLSLDPNQPLKTPSLFETNDEIDLELSFFENQGPKAMQHVALFTNIRDFDTRYDSDLSIEWNKDQPIKVHDPNEFLKDDSNVTTAINGSNLDMTFHITFAKPMATSNIVLYFWDFNRHGVVVTFEDTWKIIEGASDIVDITNSDNAAESEDNIETINKVSDLPDKIRQELNEAKPIPAWIKTSAGWWSEKKINDADFVSGIEFLIQNNVIEVPKTEPLSKPSRHIPDWLGNTAGWWSDGLIPDEAFIQSIQWLIANGVIVI